MSYDISDDLPDNLPDNLLRDFTPQGDFARAHRTTTRTLGRYRQQGLPWMYWNGEVWIGPNAEARDFILSRVRRTSGGRDAA
jgi:hypothetical protein